MIPIAMPARGRNACWATAVLLAVVSPSLATVVGTSAQVATTVQELIDGSPASVNSDDAAFPAAGADLPLNASATLTSTNLDGALVSLGQGFSEFADPARLDQPNPEEFAVEVGCYSNAESVSYTVSSEAVEDRSVIFTRSGSPAAPPEISFGFSSTREVESRVFLSGAVIFWSTAANPSPEPMQAELRLGVVRDDATKPLFETTWTLDGGSAAPSATGPIQFNAVTLDELASLGVDNASLTILERVKSEGILAVYVIPMQEHAYRYTVTADQELTLTARFEARIGNAPGGTGVAAVLGRPFQELATFIEKGLPGVNGEKVQNSVNKAISWRAIGVWPPPDTARAVPTPRLCGTGGAAMMGTFLSLGLARVVRAPRRLRPPR